MKIPHFIPYLGKSMGGPVYSLSTIAKIQQELGHEVYIYSVQKINDGAVISFPPGVEIGALHKSSWGRFRHSPALWRVNNARKFPIIHSHCLWTDVARVAANFAGTYKIPHVISPCGMVQPKALRRSWWIKVPIRIWFQDKALRQAACIHAKSHAEYKDLRRYGLRTPIAILPNPVLPPSQSIQSEHRTFWRQYGLPETRNRILFLGRIHPVKGILRLVSAWAQLRKYHEQWSLILAGPDEDKFCHVVRRHIQSLGCADSIIFTGELSGDKKWQALASADVFVMPSDFENFGLSIAEAAFVGVPIITTTGTPWEDLNKQRAGWWVAPTESALATAMNEAFDLSTDERNAMGENAKRLSARFDPNQVVSGLIDLYRWLISGEKPPACVCFN